VHRNCASSIDRSDRCHHIEPGDARRESAVVRCVRILRCPRCTGWDRRRAGHRHAEGKAPKKTGRRSKRSAGPIERRAARMRLWMSIQANLGLPAIDRWRTVPYGFRPDRWKDEFGVVDRPALLMGLLLASSVPR
jgi:hypothetical protein